MHYPANENFFLRNPESTELGRTIVFRSIQMVAQLGIEQFTFKKLAQEINSNEASIYRYFENKHKLLIYLISIYWDILNIKIRFNTQNLPRPSDKIHKLLDVLTGVVHAEPAINNVDTASLHEIVVSESAKAYLTKNIENEMREGLFLSYEKVVLTIAKLFQEANPDYEFPKAMAINLLETTYEQLFFSLHLNSLTELKEEELNSSTVKRFLQSIIFPVLNISAEQTH